jgi:hypothetical protein
MNLRATQVFTLLDRYEWQVIQGATVRCVEGHEIMEVKFVRNACAPAVAKEAADKDSVRS